MAISAQAVKQLKELTNCGMMDCKRALEETNGDVDAAIKNLREKGLAKAAKKSGRIAAEGLVYTKIDEAKKVGVVVEINVETDFAAKTDRFIEFVELVANTISTSLNRLFPKPLQKPPTRRKQEKGDDKIADTVQHVEGNPCHPGDGEHPEPSHRQIDQRTQRPKGQAKAAGQDGPAQAGVHLSQGPGQDSQHRPHI